MDITAELLRAASLHADPPSPDERVVDAREILFMGGRLHEGWQAGVEVMAGLVDRDGPSNGTRIVGACEVHEGCIIDEQE